MKYAVGNSNVEPLPALLWISYNTLLLAFIAIALPVLIPLILSTPKWRSTFRQRWNVGGKRQTGKRSGKEDRPVWIHALSVGEIIASETIVSKIREIHPGQPITISASTRSGFQTAQRLFGTGDCELIHYPFDLIWSVNQAVAVVNPLAVILVETDLWPNFLSAVNRRGIPLFLSNIRLSDKSWDWYRRLKWLTRTLFGCFNAIGVQTNRDAERFQQIGLPSERITVTGNIKFDARDADSDRDRLAPWCREIQSDARTKVIVCGQARTMARRPVCSPPWRKPPGHRARWF